MTVSFQALPLVDSSMFSHIFSKHVMFQWKGISREKIISYTNHVSSDNTSHYLSMIQYCDYSSTLAWCKYILMPNWSIFFIFVPPPWLHFPLYTSILGRYMHRNTNIPTGRQQNATFKNRKMQYVSHFWSTRESNILKFSQNKCRFKM